MKSSGLTILVFLLSLTHFDVAAAEDCTKCRCTTYPVASGCEGCCRLASATTVLQQIMATPDGGIPEEIAAKATCVVVIPRATPAPLVVGAQFGQGVVTCRTARGWSAPAFISVAGGSFGLQIGGRPTDLVLVAVNEGGRQELLKGKFKIGGEVSAAAGPVGRNRQAGTGAMQGAQFLTYSRARGLFAGVALNGAAVNENKDETDAFYGSPHSSEQILTGNIPPPEGAEPFLGTVATYFHSVSR
jgi:lipid-binding SYLF domain-containing protein